MIQDAGNIELFELLETEPKTRCTVCLSYWNVGIVYCTCAHFLQKITVVNRKLVKYTMDLLSLPEHVIKKGTLHGHRYGKKPGDKEYCLANQLKKKCKRKSSKESMTESFEIVNSVFEWLNIIEMEKFGDGGMLLQMKITLIICQNKTTSTSRTNGGFIQISKVLTHTIEKSFWFQASVVYLGTITTRSWRRTIWAYLLLLEAQTMAVGTEFIFYMVELARFLVVFLQFRKSRRRRAKSWMNGETRYL